MAKKVKKNEQPQAEGPKAAVEGGSENRQQKSEEQKAPKSGVVTTEGNLLDKIRVFQKDGATMVQAEYGKFNSKGKTTEERRKNMRLLISRPLSAEQSAEYQRLSKEDPAKAKDYAARAAYPMHVDDKAFHLKDTEINGRHVNYIIIEKLTEDKLDDKNKHLAGSWQISMGEKGVEGSRFFGLLNKEEVASIRHRAEVKLDEKGQVKSIGAPLSMADIAARVEQRVIASREARQEKIDKAEKVDWGKYKVPEGITLTNLHYAPSKDPERVWLNGKANGIEVFGLLSKNETTAVKNKIIPLEVAAVANNELGKKINAILNNSKSVQVSEADAVKAIIDRASGSEKAFSADQLKVLEGFTASAGSPEERAKMLDSLWEKAELELKKGNVMAEWIADAREELKDLSEGVVRGEEQGMKR